MPETRYRLEGWYKVLGDGGKAARAYIKGDFYEWSPHSRKWILEQQTSAATSEKDGWQQVSLEFTTPKWDPFINIVFVVEDGKAYLDDFRLARIGGRD